jgi:hypothetical protein
MRNEIWKSTLKDGETVDEYIISMSAYRRQQPDESDEEYADRKIRQADEDSRLWLGL